MAEVVIMYQKRVLVEKEKPEEQRSQKENPRNRNNYADDPRFGVRDLRVLTRFPSIFRKIKCFFSVL